MPDPFRHYENVPLLDLPADPPNLTSPLVDVLCGRAPSPELDGPELLSQLFFYSAAISASKRVADTTHRYALRVNPSSGNLHPTEVHFSTYGLKDWPDGLYHYRPSSHMAEQRAQGAFAPGITLSLTTIAWREAWKYSERAYRYCLLDAGHAWQSLALAAQAMGWSSLASGTFVDHEVAHELGLSEDEWPMLTVRLTQEGVPAPSTGGERVWYGGTPNVISDRQGECPLIKAVHASTRSIYCGIAEDAAPVGGGDIQLPPPSSSSRTFGETVRARRSALDFRGGDSLITLEHLAALLSATDQPYEADFMTTRYVQLYLYAHRVQGLEPGLYRYWPSTASLEPLRSGDQRVIAAALSLRQDLAGNACVAFSMAADIERAVRTFGDRGYRYVHFEAGAIGQRLYLAAGSLGLGATGIGAFFDDDVNEYLHLPASHQVVYHFAVGYPIGDPRLDA